MTSEGSKVTDRLRRLFGRGGRRETVVRAGMLGKHPAWNDHVRDPGMSDPALVEFSRTIYLGSLTEAIGSKWWQEVPAEERVVFGHRLLWMPGDGSAVCIEMRASRDGSAEGRSDFPLIVAVVVRPADWAFLAEVFEAAARAGEDVASLADQAAALERVRAIAQALRPASGDEVQVEPPVRGSGEDICQAAARAVLAQGSLSPEALAEVLHDVSLRVRSSRPPTRGGAPLHDDTLPCVHVRLPSASDDPVVDLLVWGRLWVALGNGRQELLLCRALGVRAVDLVWGQPSAAALRCLRAGPGFLRPIATGIVRPDPGLSQWIADLQTGLASG